MTGRPALLSMLETTPSTPIDVKIFSISFDDHYHGSRSKITELGRNSSHAPSLSLGTLFVG